MNKLNSFKLALFITALPLISSAQDGLAGKLIICNKTPEDIIADSSNGCDFNDLIEVVNLFINLLVQLSLAISVLILLITGFKYLIAGSSDAKKVAKDSFKNLAIGFAFILGSFLIVNTIFAIAGVDTAFKFLGSTPDPDPATQVTVPTTT